MYLGTVLKEILYYLGYLGIWVFQYLGIWGFLVFAPSLVKLFKAFYSFLTQHRT